MAEVAPTSFYQFEREFPMLATACKIVAFDADTSSDLYSGKLTWRLTNSQNLALSLIGDPRTTDGVVFPVAGPASTVPSV